MNKDLQKLINQHKSDILEWMESKKADLSNPVYSSYDIRDNGVKAAIVDSNLFPGGFNNLDKQSRVTAAKYFKKHITSMTDATDVLIIPEAHTRNTFYLSNLRTIKEILESAGYTVTLGTIRDDIEDKLELEDNTGKRLTLERMHKEEGNLKTKSFKGGIILLNNDFSTRAPELLEGVKDIIIPPLRLGWMHRKKMNHFRHYCATVNEFSKLIGADRWLLCPETREINDVDFKTRKNMDKVAAVVDDMILFLKGKYKQYNINEDPYVFIKDNSGTYGMGIISVKSGKEVLELNTKGRQKMNLGKERSKIDSVIVQEGISTIYKRDGSPAEPVLYAVSGRIVGGFMRVHKDRDNKESLSAPGVKFDTLLMDGITCPMGDCVNHDQLPIYTVLAGIACIAIGKEMSEL